MSKEELINWNNQYKEITGKTIALVFGNIQEITK